MTLETENLLSLRTFPTLPGVRTAAASKWAPEGPAQTVGRNGSHGPQSDEGRALRPSDTTSQEMQAL